MKGADIKKIRQEVWGTQAAMSADLGLAICTISRWENNGTGEKINEMALKYAQITKRLRKRTDI